jgi:hypothetical protein
MVRLEGLGKLKKFNDFIETQTRDLPACSIAPQPKIPQAGDWPVIRPSTYIWVRTTPEDMQTHIHGHQSAIRT